MTAFHDCNSLFTDKTVEVKLKTKFNLTDVHTLYNLRESPKFSRGKLTFLEASIDIHPEPSKILLPQIHGMYYLSWSKYSKRILKSYYATNTCTNSGNIYESFRLHLLDCNAVALHKPKTRTLL